MKSEYTDGIFNVSPKNGFLPIFEPLDKLPDRYYPVQYVIDRLHTVLLKEKGLIELDIDALPNLVDLVKEENEKIVLQALYRAYCFLTSGYLLAPAHFNKNEEGVYGKAHQVLPKQLAMPLAEVSKKLDVFPWLDYHYAYSLGNYVKKDKMLGLHWNNLRMACSFTGTQDEVGFIMNHVYINEISPKLVSGIFRALSGEVTSGLQEVLETIRDMNERRRTMWAASDHRNYNNFRAFIMGIEGNDEIFGEGVIYDGVSNEPRQYRGQTGAQDDIIPSLDIFTGVIKYYPDNILTRYLMDLRNYRPKCVQEYFQDLGEESPKFLENLTNEEKILLLAIVEQIYFFRNGHHQFILKYIMKNTKYAKATGGTPIISWVPNQIGAVLAYMSDLVRDIGNSQNDIFTRIKEGLPEKINILDRQIEELREKNYNVEKLYNLNGKLDDEKVNF